MRTLLISDLHLGQRPGHDVLHLDAALGALLDALDGVERLVLLGDAVELGSRRHRQRAMRAASPILGAIAARMGSEGEIVVVPGNHDLALVRDWLAERDGALGLADEVPADASPTLAALTEMLAPARVHVSYPGMWVREDVYATHGHYLDRHLIPESTFGVPRRRLARPGSPASPADYERARRRRAARRREPRPAGPRLRDRPLATVLEELAELTRYVTNTLRSAHLTSITSGGLDLQARHAAVPALAHAAARLGVDAPWIVFGHIHRTGPDPGERWQPWAHGPRLANTGSWVYEPLLLDHAHAPHPYWPGGAVIVTDTGDPQALRLLDGMSGPELAVRRRPR